MSSCKNDNCSTELETASEERWLHTGFCSSECRDECLDVFESITISKLYPSVEKEEIAYRFQAHGYYISGAQRALKNARRFEDDFPDTIHELRRQRTPPYIKNEPYGVLSDYYFNVTSAVDACIKFVEGEVNRTLHDLFAGRGIADNVSNERLSHFLSEASEYKDYSGQHQGYEAIEKRSTQKKVQKVLAWLERSQINKGGQIWENFDLAKDFRDQLEHSKTKFWTEGTDSVDRTPTDLIERLAELTPRENPVMHSELGAGGLVIHKDMPTIQRFISSEYGEWVHDSCLMFLKEFFASAEIY